MQDSVIVNAEELEYIDERRDRLNMLAELARARNVTIPCPAATEPPLLKPDGALVDNRFCPTGAGGGVDPSCGADASGHVGGDRTLKEAHAHGAESKAPTGAHGEGAHAKPSEALEHAGHKAHDAEHANHLVHSLSHGHFGLHEIGVVAGKVLEPVVHKIGELAKRIPGVDKAVHAISALNRSTHDLAKSIIDKAISRYGHGAVGAALGGGGFISAMSAKAVHLGALEAVTHKATKYLGAIPLLAMAEAGYQVGIVAPNTKLDKGLAKAAVGIHAVESFVTKGAYSGARYVAGKARKAITGNTIHDIALQNEIISQFLDGYNELLAQNPVDSDELFDELEASV